MGTLLIASAAFTAILSGCTAGSSEPVVVAEGGFQDASAEASGTVTVARQPGGEIEVRLSDVQVSISDDLQLVTSDRVIDPDETCFETGEPMRGSAPYAPSVDNVYVLPPGANSDSLAAIAIVVPAETDEGCLIQLVAFANLDWGQGIPQPGTLGVDAGTVVATGAFADSAGQVTGDVTVTADDKGTFVLEITGFSTSTPRFDLSAIDVAIGDGDRCLTDPWRIAWGTSQGTDLKLKIDESDPSFLSTIIVTSLPEESSSGCPIEVLGYADLIWTIPDLRPGLVVRESGAQAGATGTTETDAGGAPTSYVAADGDSIEAIWRRFGLTADELSYLNPAADLDINPMVQAGQRLNLSKDNR